jgi:hypothetical protein
MTSTGRTAAAIFFLAALAAAVPFARGTRFGMVGLDCACTSAFKPSSNFYDGPSVAVDPSFRGGIAVLPDLAVGAELALLNTIPGGGDMFTSTPVFAFGPSATWFFIRNSYVIRPYAAASGGATYGFIRRDIGWRVRLGVGAMVVSELPVAFGFEAGWYGDWYRPRGTSWERGDTGFLGIRIMGFKR